MTVEPVDWVETPGDLKNAEITTKSFLANETDRRTPPYNTKRDSESAGRIWSPHPQWSQGETGASSAEETLMKIPTKLAVVAGAVTAGVTFGLVAPSDAGVGETNAEWDASCEVVSITSTKDISNVVYMIDGTAHRIEFTDGTHDLLLPGEITELWVKAGNNKSDDGSGYGEHYTRPDGCLSTSDDVLSS